MKVVKREQFIVSDGNIAVLSIVPEMMQNPVWRKKLRVLVFEYKLRNQKV